MAFRSACQRLRVVRGNSRINRGLSEATEQSRHAIRSQKQVASSSGTWLLGNTPAPRRGVSRKLYQCEACRNLSTIFPSEEEERKELSNATSRSQVEGVLSQAPADNNGSTGITSSANISVESAYVSSPRHDLALLFTCTICETRSAKTMSRASYETGVVIVRCPGCQKLHLIADRYGWFGEKGGVEDFLAEKGIDTRTGSDSTYEFTVEDLTGWTHEKPEKV